MRILFDLVIGFFFVSNFDLVIEKQKQVLGFPESEKIVLSIYTIYFMRTIFLILV